MPETSEQMPAAAHVRRPGNRKEDWIASQLRHVYDDALKDAIPPQMLELLQALDESDADTTGQAEKSETKEEKPR